MMGAIGWVSEEMKVAEWLGLRGGVVMARR